MTIKGLQMVPVDTIVGTHYRYAPAGWTFDKSTTRIWSRLLTETEDLVRLTKNRETRKAARKTNDLAAFEHGCNLLAILLADILGMAPFYWEQAALKLVQEGKLWVRTSPGRSARGSNSTKPTSQASTASANT